jgi:hypothetical protein
MGARPFAALLALVVLAASGGADAGGLPNPYVTSYPFASAIIHYRIRTEIGHGGERAASSRRAEEGAQTIYIKGQRLAKVTRLGAAETLQVYTADHVATVDLKAGTGTRIANPKKHGRLAYARLSEEEQAAFHRRLGERGLVSFDLPYVGRKIGTEQVAGQRCDVYQLGAPAGGDNLLGQAVIDQDRSMRTCLWAGGVPLLIERSRFGWREEIVATRVETNVPIPDARFVVPDGTVVADDRQKSELERRYAVARFELYRTGAPMLLRIQAEETEDGRRP